MLSRCRNPKHVGYKYYGGRGIKVCERWLKFENFLADMGERPLGLMIDRIDNDGDYDKSNCRWVTAIEQLNNRRGVHQLMFRGETKSISQWAKHIGIHTATLFWRIRKWPLEQALTKPVRRKQKRENVKVVGTYWDY